MFAPVLSPFTFSRKTAPTTAPTGKFSLLSATYMNRELSSQQ